ncbi:MAG: cation:proton antiporter [Myxococcales bacterium]|nr:cation:proton antiporter [Myxococcales bacterium]MCB9718235.1 cation:proton antiporter [Myxococcales bacterium]
MAAASLVTDLALVLGVAALTGTVTRALRQPPILGYLVAGLVVGPYIPIPLFADVERVHELSELGVVLVMFAVGLELSLARAAKVLPVAGLTAVVQIGGMFWAGNLLGAALGLSTVGAVVLGASVAISSTMVVTKVFDVHPPPADVRSTVLGILVLQDLAAIVLITVVTAVAEGAAVAPSALLGTVGRLLGVMAVGILLGLWVVPRLARRIARLQSPEVDTVFAVGLCLALAALMERLSYSPALGAFLGGMLVAESGLGRHFEHLVAPLRDVFAAVFFVSIGMTVDPLLAIDHLGTAGLIALMVVVLQVGLVTGAGVLGGQGLRQSGHAGVALGQIGEFGFIIMGIGITAGVVPASMFTVVVVAAVITAITTPLALRFAPAVLVAIEHRLPHRLRAHLSLYAAWVDGLRRGEGSSPVRRAIRKALRMLVVDAAVVAGIVIGVSLGWTRAIAWSHQALGTSPTVAAVVLVGLTAVIAFPFARGLSRAASALGERLARGAFPAADQTRPDLAATARRAMSVGLRLAALLGAGMLVAALTQPFVPPGIGVVLLAAVLLPSAVLLWRSGGPLGEHVGSATLALLEVLRRDAPPDEPQLHDLLHGLGDATPVRLVPGAAAIGRTLAQLDLRAASGAMVLAIARPDRDVITPTGRETLCEGDVLAVAGPLESIERARALLLGTPPPEAASATENPSATEE